MLFNSYEFIFLFLPLTLSAFFFLSRLKFLKLSTFILVIASLAFYAYWDYRYIPLLVASILFNHNIGKIIERSPRKWLLVFGLIVNIGLLSFFKYTCFFLNTCNYFFSGSIPVPEIVMPIGISFFTFTQIAYLVDAYRGETKGYDLLSYSLFVTFFPHLIAGPILYHKDMIPQFRSVRHFMYSHENMARGVVLFGLGLFKKVVIADKLSVLAGPVFDRPEIVTLLEAWGGALAYTFQLYFDFSGYTDMALGIGLMLNVSLPVNFNSPYRATSIIDFWKRWHITLSTFLKRYLYIPLGGNRCGEARKALNIMITMLLGGLWHGAGWTFVIWGGLHGIYVLINHGWRKLDVAMPALLGRTLTFVAVVFAWVFFRAKSVPDAILLIKAMFGGNGFVLPQQDANLLWIFGDFGIKFANVLKVATLEKFSILIGLYLLILCAKENLDIVSYLRPRWWMAFGAGIFVAISILSINRVTEFLYFQF